MASYQEIDTKVKVLEDKVDFLMTNMRMRAVISSGVLGADGKPQGQVIDGNMLDFYLMSKTQSLPVVGEGELPAEQDSRLEKEQETVNG